MSPLSRRLRESLVAVCLAAAAMAQPPAPNPAAGQPPAAPQPAAPAAPPAAAPQPPAPAAAPTVGNLSLNNASLTEVIDLLARQLKLNYILDPRVKGGIILNTYGETRDIDARSLLDTILRINGYAMVKQGDLYRIVLLPEISHLPIPPESKTDASAIPEDDQTMLNLIFLKYMSSDELMKVLQPFVGENASIYTYAPANLLLMLDSRRNMRRLMELIALFDSDQLANQRVRVFEVKNGRPSDLVKDLEDIVKNVALSDKSAPIKFIPINRINTIIAVAPNPGAFTQVETWLAKLDIPVKVTVDAVNNYVYRVRFGEATSIACSIQALYGQLAGNVGYPGFGMGGLGSIAACMMQNGTGPGGGMNGPGMMQGGVYPGGVPYQNNMLQNSMYGGGYGGGYPGAYGAPYGYPPPPAAAVTPFTAAAAAPTGATPAPGQPGAPAATAGSDITGTYLGTAPTSAFAFTPGRAPRVVANPFNNTLLIQATPQEYDSILNLLRDLDIPPRQVLIEAKIYSVDLTHAFASDVSAQLQALSGTTARSFLGDFAGATTNLTASMLVGKSRELLGIVKLQESESRAKILSNPAVIATDSIPASIMVGGTVPTLAGQTASGITGAVSNAISNTSTGIGLNITARVTPSGIVTMVINQNVSDPTPTTTSNIASPSFATKNITTQITVQDGDTIAIGGMISETNAQSSAGIPVLHRIPVLGALFGSRSYSTDRTELIIFITPHVIYDSNQMLDATDELRDRIKLLRKDVKE